MHKDTLLLLSAIFIPIVGSCIVPFATRISSAFRNLFSLSLIGISLVCSLFLIPVVSASKSVSVSYNFPIGLHLAFSADVLSVFMAITSSMISLIIIIYSFDYISHYANQTEYYAMVTLFIGSMMALVYSTNLIFMYIFWEITAITSWRLIGFFREKEYVLKADKAFLTTVFGALLMLIGFIAIFNMTGSFDLPVIKSALNNTALPNFVVFLILAGILTKSATLPFHTWLPDAGVAPSPVTALLHAAVLVKIGVYVYGRLFVASFSINPVWDTIILIIAASSALISAGAAMIENNIKRIIAYSTISQIAFIFLGLAAGGEIGIAGALLYILMHALAKGGLFLCAGIVEQNTHTKDITKMGGLIKTMPVTAFAFLICSFSVMGIPPLGGFFSKAMVMIAGFSKNRWLAFIFIIGAIMTILYLLRAFIMIFFSEPQEHQEKEGSPVMVTCVAAIAILSILGGIYIQYPAKFTHMAIRQMLGL